MKTIYYYYIQINNINQLCFETHIRKRSKFTLLNQYICIYIDVYDVFNNICH